jgi:hypothetical protein
MSFDELLKNYEFLQLTDEGKDILINFGVWYQKYEEKSGPFCTKCEEGSSNCSYHQDQNNEAVSKLFHILNQIYWEQVDLIPDGVSIDRKDFMPQVFSKYFTLPEAINAIIHNKSGAPICGLGRFITDVTSSLTFFDIKRCQICNQLTDKYHYIYCSICN